MSATLGSLSRAQFWLVTSAIVAPSTSATPRLRMTFCAAPIVGIWRRLGLSGRRRRSRTTLRLNAAGRLRRRSILAIMVASTLAKFLTEIS